MHPLDNSKFGSTINEPVWYLSHPLAPDKHKSYKQNMASVLEYVRLFYEEGVRVIAPYHTICLALTDDNDEYRRIGLEVDLVICKTLGRIILVGHKISRGMAVEAETLRKENRTQPWLLNYVGQTKQHIRNSIRLMKSDKVI